MSQTGQTLSQERKYQVRWVGQVSIPTIIKAQARVDCSTDKMFSWGSSGQMGSTFSQGSSCQMDQLTEQQSGAWVRWVGRVDQLIIQVEIMSDCSAHKTS